MNGSWKTTLTGLLGGLVLVLGPQVGAKLQGDPTAPPITFQNYGPAIILALLGLLAKDKDKTNSPTPIPAHTAVIAAPEPAEATPNFPAAR